MELNKLKENFDSCHLTLGSVESFTGGLFAATIVSISGASSFFKGALVTYATEVKVEVCGVDKEIANRYGVVSEQVAKEMAIKGREKLNVDVCISFTGNAGPIATENKPVGLVYLCIAFKDQCNVYPFHLQGDREKIRQTGVEKGVELLNLIF